MWVRHWQGCAWRYGAGVGWGEWETGVGSKARTVEGAGARASVVLRGLGMRLAVEMVSVMPDFPGENPAPALQLLHDFLLCYYYWAKTCSEFMGLL